MKRGRLFLLITALAVSVAIQFHGRAAYAIIPVNEVVKCHNVQIHFINQEGADLNSILDDMRKQTEELKEQRAKGIKVDESSLKGLLKQCNGRIDQLNKLIGRLNVNITKMNVTPTVEADGLTQFVKNPSDCGHGMDTEGIAHGVDKKVIDIYGKTIDLMCPYKNDGAAAIDKAVDAFLSRPEVVRAFSISPLFSCIPNLTSELLKQILKPFMTQIFNKFCFNILPDAFDIPVLPSMKPVPIPKFPLLPLILPFSASLDGLVDCPSCRKLPYLQEVPNPINLQIPGGWIPSIPSFGIPIPPTPCQLIPGA